MTKIDDNSLIKKARDGEPNAEDVIVSRYKTYVEILAKPYFLVGGDSEDIVQIGMIGLLKAVRNFDETREGNFKTYASKCIKNAILDGVREANTQKNLPLNTACAIPSCESDDDAELIETFPSSSPSPEEQLIAKEAEEAFFGAISEALGSDNFDIIRLYLSAVPYKEISEQLGITAKKVDNTIYNAKKKIEKILGKI